jgi:hypothetical protein
VRYPTHTMSRLETVHNVPPRDSSDTRWTGRGLLRRAGAGGIDWKCAGRRSPDERGQSTTCISDRS